MSTLYHYVHSASTSTYYSYLLYLFYFGIKSNKLLFVHYWVFVSGYCQTAMRSGWRRVVHGPTNSSDSQRNLLRLVSTSTFPGLSHLFKYLCPNRGSFRIVFLNKLFQKFLPSLKYTFQLISPLTLMTVKKKKNLVWSTVTWVRRPQVFELVASSRVILILLKYNFNQLFYLFQISQRF